MQGVTYRWIEGSGHASQDLQIGLIAQDAELCIPEVVDTDSKGFKSLAYDRLVVPLIENAHELQTLAAAQSQALTAQIEVNLTQQQEIAELRTRLDRLETLLEPRR